MSSVSYIVLGLGITAGLIVFLRLLGALYRAKTVRRVRFSDGRASLFIDEAAQELVVSQTDRTGVHRLPLGTLTWRDTGTGVRLASFNLPYAYRFGKFNENDKQSVRDTVEVWVGEGNTGELMRWLNFRAKRLGPDIEGHARALNAQKKEIAAAARRHLPETPVVECDTGLVIEHYAYAAFLPSGFVYGMRGADGLPQPVFCVRGGDVHRGNGHTVQVEIIGGSPATFELNDTQLRLVHELQEKGVLRLQPPLVSAY